MTQPGHQSSSNGSVALSSVVMAHPARSKLAEELVHKHPKLNMRIVYDPEPHGPANPARTAALAWGAVEPGATHHLVVQDDVTLCDDFSDRVRLNLGLQPRLPLALFTHWAGRMGQLVRFAALSGYSWCPAADVFLPSVATVLPCDIALGLSEFLHRHQGERRGRDAFLMVDYFAESGHSPHYCVPNLAQHDSLGPRASVGGSIRPATWLRRSSCFINGTERRPEIAAEAMPLPESLPHQGALPALWPYQLLDATFSITSSNRRGVYEWDDQRTLDWLRSRGWEETDLVSMFRESVEATRSHHLLGFLSEAMLFESWLTSFATGTQLDRYRLSAALHRPVARAALATALPGPICRVLPPVVAERLCVTSVEFTQHAICAGSELSRSSVSEVAPDERVEVCA